MNFKVRAHVNSQVLRAFIAVVNEEINKKTYSVYADGLFPSCINCHFFDQREEICKRANARPPAKVIALGCEAWDDIDDIPF